MESVPSALGEQLVEQMHCKPPSKFMMKRRPSKRTSAPETPSPTMMAIRHLVEKTNETRKVPYLVRQLSVFFSTG